MSFIPLSYPDAKLWHVAFVYISIVFFNIRFWLFHLIMKGQRPKLLKILPQVIDSVLFVLGIALIIMTGYIPFTSAAPWLSAKLAFLVFYVLFGVIALRGKSLFLKFTGYLLANLCVGEMIYLAINKSFFSI